MSVLAGLFLIAHALVHVAVWVAPAPPDVPFDSRHSWLVGDTGRVPTTLAIAACGLLALAGVLVLVDAGRAVAVAGAALSLGLVLVTFNRWLVVAVALDIAIIAVALS